MKQLRTNRLVSRKDARELSLPQRIALEAQVTDALGAHFQIPSIPPDWTFTDYSNRSPWRKCMFEFLGPLAGKTILDLGCGYNPTPVYFALAGAKKVIACDVSPRAIAFVTTMARDLGLQEQIVPACVPAAHLPFEDESIDLIHGEAVLHHLDLSAEGAELSRVLKKGGRAAFKDPLGHNFLLEFARDHFDYRWKHAVKGTDCPLRFSDIKRFGQHFSRCDARAFGLLSMLVTALCGQRQSYLKSLAHWIDAPLVRFVPGLRYFCRFVVTCVEK